MAHIKKRPDGTCILTIGFKDGTIAHQEEIERILDEHAGHGETAAYVLKCVYEYERRNKAIDALLEKLSFGPIVASGVSYRDNSEDGCADIRSSFED